jgi:hypothetical protein
MSHIRNLFLGKQWNINVQPQEFFGLLSFVLVPMLVSVHNTFGDLRQKRLANNEK